MVSPKTSFQVLRTECKNGKYRASYFLVLFLQLLVLLFFKCYIIEILQVMREINIISPFSQISYLYNRVEEHICQCHGSHMVSELYSCSIEYYDSFSILSF